MKPKTLPQKDIYSDSNLFIFSFSYLSRASNFSSFTKLAGSFPTKSKGGNRSSVN